MYPQDPYGAPPPQGPGPGYAPSQYGAGPGGVGPPADDTLGWAGIALGGVGWVSCCCGFIPLVGIIGGLGGLLCSVAAIVCGYMAYAKGKQQGTRTDLGVIGIVLGATKLVLFVGVIVLAVVLMIAGVGMAELQQYAPQP